MGWQDRPYYRDQGPSSGNPLMWLLSGSVPLFTVFGIHVRMHVSLLLLIAIGLLIGLLNGPAILLISVIGYTILFIVVLLHEFGHCFAARWMGGDAREILMWPLGGLAMADAPNRPWPQLVTTAGGPMVNVLICAITRVTAFLMFHYTNMPWNPLVQKFPATAIGLYVLLWWVYTISLGLLFFNLLPIFPMDGGRLLQELLWFKLGYYRATLIACVVGMVGAVLMVLYGIVSIGSWYGLFIAFLGVSCFMYCYQTRAAMKAEGPWAFEEENADYSAAMWHPDDDEPRPKRKRLSRRAVRKLRRQAQAEEAEQARIDAILAKVSAHGMHSLSWRERRALRKATERRRREMELTRESD
jgi:Zn-dependent protease